MWGVSDGVKLEMLSAWVDGLVGNPDWQVCLYINDYTPTDSDTSLSYDEATFDGYAREPISPGDWGAPYATEHMIETIHAALCVFGPSSSATNQLCYGYYVLDDDDAWVYGERFDVPQLMQAGKVLRVKPRFRLVTRPSTP